MYFINFYFTSNKEIVKFKVYNSFFDFFIYTKFFYLKSCNKSVKKNDGHFGFCIINYIIFNSYCNKSYIKNSTYFAQKSLFVSVVGMKTFQTKMWFIFTIFTKCHNFFHFAFRNFSILNNTLYNISLPC